MTTFPQLAFRIIKEQELIIGPIAWDQARKVAGLRIVDKKTGEIAIEGSEKDVLQHLVEQYELLFGRASVEVCRDAVRSLIHDVPREKLPEVLA